MKEYFLLVKHVVKTFCLWRMRGLQAEERRSVGLLSLSCMHVWTVGRSVVEG